MLNRVSRRTLLISGIGAITASCAASRSSMDLAVYKTPGCDCCTAWVDHMRAAGFTARIDELQDLRSLRISRGISDDLASCHTVLVGGYVLEGHVPAEDVRKLLRERPRAVGLAVPAMPLGSPGMEMPDGRREAFDTLLVLKDGGTRVFASHGEAT